MATRRRSQPPRRRSRSTGPSAALSPEVIRSLTGIVLLVLGAVLLIGQFFPGGVLTDWIRNVIAPWFGSGRWALPFLLIGAGLYVERASGPRSGWPRVLLGGGIAYLAALGLVAVLEEAGFLDGRSGGTIGQALGSTLSSLVTPLGAFVVLLALLAGGIVIMLDRPLRSLLERPVAGVRGIGAAMTAGTTRDPAADTGAPGRTANGGRGRGGTPPKIDAPGQTGIWGGVSGDRPPIPPATPTPAPVSATFAPPMGANGGDRGGPPVPAPAAVQAAAAVAVAERAPMPLPRDVDDVTDAGDGAPAGDEPPYSLPPLTLLDDVLQRNGGQTMDHARNASIIENKLASFNIPARVVHWNAGPVVTQYEITPDPSVKVSRIEGLADDLAMALAARTIRIEAPIPGKTVVGVEIPNTDFNIVALRRILEEVDMRSGSRLTFALGRDVAGHARATDLAKMPHLLIAGATGSGKSVMVNALITSLLMNATPDDVRIILMDLKRVELASYNELPHLLVPVITEPERAKAALKWVVGEMESRYRRFAGATARNITAFNESRADPADRLPYIVIIIDELADLMMREGKNVEDPVVRLAQKARATGIHMVLATQRPSVNVVTGLIKANFPSRIAFAMASQIDSRTILDAPGAEDLIGRGDMLFQPADMPKPIRLQGVFVSDREIKAVTEFWRSWDHHYDLAIVETDEGEGSIFDEPPDDDADRLLPDAIEVVREYDRASASLLQRRLRIGYARAARIIDQLEARGYVGPFDGSNARQVLRRESGPAMGEGGDDEP
jgi:S-DNA-T family DNA segregation ATPase FtsK/SpoIIIE